VTPDLARSLEGLGFGALWLGGSPSGDLAVVDELLSATTTLIVATGIVNICRATRTRSQRPSPESKRLPWRFVLGVGAGHREATKDYAKPYDALVSYIDVLIADGVPGRSMVLAALGPRMLRLAPNGRRARIPISSRPPTPGRPGRS